RVPARGEGLLADARGRRAHRRRAGVARLHRAGVEGKARAAAPEDAAEQVALAEAADPALGRPQIGGPVLREHLGGGVRVAIGAPAREPPQVAPAEPAHVALRLLAEDLRRARLAVGPALERRRGAGGDPRALLDLVAEPAEHRR